MARILKRDAERLLANVPEGQVFWCCDGRVMRNVRELGDALSVMSDESYACHANPEKNDFRNWVRDVIGDQKLARDLVKSASRTQAAEMVANRLAFLNTKLEM
jgi:hypothetical protein